MPKGTEPSVRVLAYFQDAPLAEAKQSLAAVRHIVNRREAESEAGSTVAVMAKRAKKARKARANKKETAAKAAAETQAAPRKPTSLRPSAGSDED